MGFGGGAVSGGPTQLDSVLNLYVVSDSGGDVSSSTLLGDFVADHYPFRES